MERKYRLSRRRFLAASSTGLLAGGLQGQDTRASQAADSRLALEGGTKAVREGLPRLVRWGEPERERLNSLLAQDTLFYWKGPQTALLVERFRKICPLQH